MAMCDRFVHGIGGHAHAKFLWLYFFGASNQHGFLLFWSVNAVMRRISQNKPHFLDRSCSFTLCFRRNLRLIEN
jgi:hypothetical protein